MPDLRDPRTVFRQLLEMRRPLEKLFSLRALRLGLQLGVLSGAAWVLHLEPWCSIASEPPAFAGEQSSRKNPLRGPVDSGVDVPVNEVRARKCSVGQRLAQRAFRRRGPTRSLGHHAEPHGSFVLRSNDGPWWFNPQRDLYFDCRVRRAIARIHIERGIEP